MPFASSFWLDDTRCLTTSYRVPPLVTCPMSHASYLFNFQKLDTTPWLPLLCLGLPCRTLCLTLPLATAFTSLAFRLYILPVAPCHPDQSSFFLANCFLPLDSRHLTFLTLLLSTQLFFTPPPKKKKKPTHPTIYLDTRNLQICYPDHIWNWS